MATWTYFDWIGQNLRQGLAWRTARFASGRRAQRRRLDWRGLFGRRSGERVATMRISGEAVSRPFGGASQAPHRFRASPATLARIDRMRRAAVLDIFDQVGLAPLPGQLWRFVDAVRDPGAGVADFLGAIGIDPARIIARDPDETERANEVLELLFSIDHVFDRIAPALAAELEARLCSGAYATVRVAAQVVATFESIARMETRWPAEVRLGVLDRFIGDVRAGLADPLAAGARDAAAAAVSAEVLTRQMVAFDAELHAFHRLAHDLGVMWPRAWTNGPQAEARRQATRSAEHAHQHLCRDRHLQQAQVDALIGQLAKAGGVLAGLIDRIEGIAGGEGRRRHSDAAKDRAAPHSDIDRALVFFGFAIDARPDRATVRARFRDLARTTHPDHALTDAASQQAAHGRFVELNRNYELLKLRT